MTPGERIAAAARDTLADGPMSWDLRREDMAALLSECYQTDGERLLRGMHAGPGSKCAIMVGAWAIRAGLQSPRPPPRTPAITTWTGFGGFGGRHWIPVDRVTLEIGDVLYWCGGSATTWPAATNGHVGVLLDGDGWRWRTAEGGGGADGTLCRMSAAPKDIRTSGARPLRGVWRPGGVSAAAPGPRTLRLARPYMTGLDVETLQVALGKIVADGVFGPQTEARVREYQQRKGLVADGIVGPKTWSKIDG